MHKVGGLADLRYSPHSGTGSDAHSQRHCHFACYYWLSLEEFHLYSLWHSITGIWGQIGRDGSFIMEQVPAWRFVIEI